MRLTEDHKATLIAFGAIRDDNDFIFGNYKVNGNGFFKRVKRWSLQRQFSNFKHLVDILIIHHIIAP